MFKPINSRVDEPQIREMLEYAVVLEPDALEEALALYRSGAANCTVMRTKAKSLG
ncbi:hypothetical protein HMSSN036_35370 [Paenibacillus macerans]|nr:hypothetical protein HMSSN036_35370 [Paenibacillus macerans]